MKEFDLELAKAGNPVCTRYGKPARIICFDVNNDYPIVALVKGDRGIDIVRTFTNDGKQLKENNSHLDLMMAPEKKFGWVNIWKDTNDILKCGYVHETKEEAINSINNCNIFHSDCGTVYDNCDTIYKKHIATVKIEWEE